MRIQKNPRTLDGLVVEVDLVADLFLGVAKLGWKSLLSDDAQRGVSGGVRSLQELWYSVNEAFILVNQQITQNSRTISL